MFQIHTRKWMTPPYVTDSQDESLSCASTNMHPKSPFSTYNGRPYMRGPSPLAGLEQDSSTSNPEPDWLLSQQALFAMTTFRLTQTERDVLSSLVRGRDLDLFDASSNAEQIQGASATPSSSNEGPTSMPHDQTPQDSQNQQQSSVDEHADSQCTPGIAIPYLEESDCENESVSNR